jgi:hypothetical protein
MFVALRSGELDELIGFEADEGAVTDQSANGTSARKKSSHPPPAVEKFPAVEEKSYAASRPAGIFSVPPPSSGNPASIFGEVGLDEKSLDDAILSYLAEDPDEDEES